MSKHTPGPWYWTDDYTTQDGRKTWSVVAECGYGVLSCDGTRNSPQCCNSADADIIAAAPDLLAACKYGTQFDLSAFLDWVADRFVQWYGERPNTDYILRLRTQADLIRAAIAKAEGGAE